MSDDKEIEMNDDPILSDDVSIDDDLDSFPEDLSTTYDGFDDDLEFDTSYDEDIENDFDGFDDIDYSKPVEKSGPNWFNIGIVGAVVVAVIAIIYSNFPGLLGGGTSTQPPQQVASQQAQQQTVTETASQQQEQPSLFDNPDILGDGNDSLPEKTNNTPEVQNVDSNPTMSNDEMDELFAAIPTPQPQIPTPPTEEATIPDLSAIDTLPKPSDSDAALPTAEVDFTSIEMVNENPIQNEVSASVTPSNTNNVNSEAINARIDEINQSMASFMEHLENRIDDIQKPQPQTITVDNSQQINRLEETISRLENRLNELAAKQESTITSPVSPQPAAPTTPVVVMEEKATSPEPAEILTPVPSTPTPKKTVSAPKRVEPAYVPPKIVWELRGASNGQAFLAERGTQNLRTVSVGQTLRDLGRITSIAQENGRWIVRATNGVVRQ